MLTIVHMYQLLANVAVDRTEKSQRQFNIAPQQFIVPQTKRHNYHGSWKLWSWAVGKVLNL